MATKLPVIKANTKEDNIIKMKFIAEKNKRSVSKELEYIIEKHIAEFESKYGEIEIVRSTPKEIIEDIGKQILKKPPYGDG